MRGGFIPRLDVDGVVAIKPVILRQEYRVDVLRERIVCLCWNGNG
jgi:hypothetical protein